MIREVPRIEIYMLERTALTPSFSAAVMRDVSQFLVSLCGVLRSESLYKVDLCDLCAFFIHLEHNKEIDPCHIFVMIVG